MNPFKELIVEARTHAGYLPPSDNYSADLIYKLIDALETKETWFEDSKAYASENSVLRNRVAVLEATMQSHHFAAGSL